MCVLYSLRRHVASHQFLHNSTSLTRHHLHEPMASHKRGTEYNRRYAILGIETMAL